MYYVNSNQKRAGVSILIVDKIGFKIKIHTRSEEVHFIMVKGSILQEDTTIKNLYAPTAETKNT